MMSAIEIADYVSKSRRFAAPRERVFRAWTRPEELAEWWRPGKFSTAAVSIDLRAGGRYEILMTDSGGARQRLHGIYVDVVFPERLVMTWNLEGSPADDGYTALLTLEFIEEPEGTLLRLRHERLRPAARGMFDAGWEAMMGALAGHFQETNA